MIDRKTTARIPTAFGEFRVAFFDNSIDNKEHLAFIYGDVFAGDDVLVRIHSECFTGDVVGSLRCDCGQQLTASMQNIANEGAGLVIYLRQEGRGIGLLNKLKAYNLQDDGYDTVEANVMLGHEPDERDYTLAALMLEHFGVSSVRLLTNNPNKVEQLQRLNIAVTRRVPIPPIVNAQNERYLRTKAERMRHKLHVNGTAPAGTTPPRGRHHHGLMALQSAMPNGTAGRPFVTLSYAQSLDGSIAARPGRQLLLSGHDALVMTHQVRAMHDAILVGIGTVEADDPRLTVRHVDGEDPVPVVLDTHLRFPDSARLLRRPGPAPVIATGPSPDADRRERLERQGACVVPFPLDSGGQVDIKTVLKILQGRGLGSLMVEGGAKVITSFLHTRMVDYLVLTITNRLVGGIRGVRRLCAIDGSSPERQSNAGFPRLKHMYNRWYGDDLVIQGEPVWEVGDAA